MVEFKLYVEGGGKSKALRSECRDGFSSFLKKSKPERLPRIVACGSREEAYDRFCTAIAQGQKAFLLVDSETPVAAKHMTGAQEDWNSWEHLRESDHWEKPDSATNQDCHLMVQIMESWFLADKDSLVSFFGQGFRNSSLPSQTSVETISKSTVLQSLTNASRSCKTKACFDKSLHSFKILARIAPEHVRAHSPWAERFIHSLRNKLVC